MHDLLPPALAPRVQLCWRWRFDKPLLDADLRRRDGDDSPLKFCALFDLPIEQLGFVERNLLRTARTITSEKLPAATLCYVWFSTLPAGTLLRDASTERLRMIVMDRRKQRLGQWVLHSQNLAVDFLRAFGQESLTVPPLIDILVDADSDNTACQSLVYVGDITLAV